MELDFVRIECELISDIPVPLTTVLHGELQKFESHFKIASCSKSDADCSSCLQQNGCAYQIVFNQKLSSNPEIVRLHQKPSLPFSLYVRPSADNASSYAIGIVVIGSAVNYVESFHTALLRMITTAAHSEITADSFILHSYCLDYQGRRHKIACDTSFSEGVILLSSRHILQNTVHSDFARLSLVTPLRLLCNGSVMHNFDFASFFRSQMRRCSSLCAYYGSEKLGLDFVYLSKAAKNVTVSDNKIHYNKYELSNRLDRFGLIGSVKCLNLVEPMLSLLILGSHFSAGKGAAFGSGFHEIEVL